MENKYNYFTNVTRNLRGTNNLEIWYKKKQEKTKMHSVNGIYFNYHVVFDSQFSLFM